MKVKQPRRWKKHTVQEQGEISNRFSGRILWAMLLLGGIGTLIALGILLNLPSVLQQSHPSRHLLLKLPSHK